LFDRRAELTRLTAPENCSGRQFGELAN